MVSLKKNDKIIIIVAILVLVVAGVGIAMYQSPKTSSDLSSLITSEKNYNVIWTVRNGSLNTISDFAGKKSPYQGTVMISEPNVKSITFYLSWTDDRMTFMKRMGLDSLTLEVTMLDGVYSFIETNKSAPLTGEGTISYTIVNGIIPPETPIKAVDEKDAQAQLKDIPYYDDSWTDKDITINVSVDVGEIRLLKKMRDKGNNFELEITYEYYDGILEEDINKDTGEGNDTPPDDPWNEQVIPPYISMIINTGCGRYV